MSENEQGPETQEGRVVEQVEQEPLSNLDAAILNVQRSLVAIHNQLAQMNARMTEGLLFKRASALVDAKASTEEFRIDLGLFQKIGNTVIHPIAWGLIIPEGATEKDEEKRTSLFIQKVAKWAHVVGIRVVCEGKFKVTDHNAAVGELRKRMGDNNKADSGAK